MLINLTATLLINCDLQQQHINEQKHGHKYVLNLQQLPNCTTLHQYSKSLTMLTFAVEDRKSIGCQLRGTFNPYDERTATPKNPCVQNTQIYSN